MSPNSTSALGSALSISSTLNFTRTSLSDMLVTPLHSTTPFFYIGTHSGLSSQPSITVHVGSPPTPDSPPIATAQFESFSGTTDVDLGQALGQHVLSKHGFFNAVTYFSATVPATGITERFEWKRSSGDQVSALGGGGHGLKCTRMSNEQVVAAWAGEGMIWSTMGKMGWFGGNELGPTVEMMIFMGLLAVLERGRRDTNSGVIAAVAS